VEPCGFTTEKSGNRAIYQEETRFLKPWRKSSGNKYEEKLFFGMGQPEKMCVHVLELEKQ